MIIQQSVFARLDALRIAASERHSVIDLGIGSPDMPMPREVREVLSCAVLERRDHGYPPWRGIPAFLDAAARFMERRFGVVLDARTEILCTSGAEEAFMHMAMTFLGPSATCLLGDIHYPTHMRSASLVGADVRFIPLRAEAAYLPRFADVPQADLESARVLVLNYPHNPTGAVADLDVLNEAVEFCRVNELLLVSDLAYSEITFDGHAAPSVLQVPGARDVAIELHSFSKSFSMAGLRLAFVAGSATALERMYRLRTMCTYGSPASLQRTGAFVLDNADTVSRDIVEAYRIRRDVFCRGVSTLGWRGSAPRGGMFFWLPVPAGFSSNSFVEFLIEEAGVVVTPGHAFGPGGEGWFRVALVAEEPVLEEAIGRMHAAGVCWNRSVA